MRLNFVWNTRWISVQFRETTCGWAQSHVSLNLQETHGIRCCAVQTVSIEMKRAKIHDLFIDDTLKWAYMELNLTESRVFHTIFTYNELLFGKKNASKRRDLLQHSICWLLPCNCIFFKWRWIRSVSVVIYYPLIHEGNIFILSICKSSNWVWYSP